MGFGRLLDLEQDHDGLSDQLAYGAERGYDVGLAAV
jgi:hypothetical protein